MKFAQRKNQPYSVFSYPTADQHGKETAQGQNKERTLKDTLRNNTNSKNKDNKNSEQNDEENQGDNFLKSEAEKYFKQCGVERSSGGNENYNSYRNRGNGNNKYGEGNRNDYYGNSRSGNNGNNYNRYGQESEDKNNSNEGEWNSYSSHSWNQNQRDGTNFNGYTNKRQSGRGDQQSNYGQSNSNGDSNMRNNNQYGGPSSNRNGNDGTNFEYGSGYSQNNQDDSIRGSNNNQPSYGFGTTNRGYQGSSTNAYDTRSPYNPNRGYNRGGTPNEDCADGDGRGYGTNMFGYNTGMSFGFTKPQHRQRRFSYFDREDSQENENTQCVSQCVFGYLHLLDDDRSPSETMLIKWLQEHVTGNDMDRVKALRDARRCFARLTTSDIEDGCEFSKELSKCLELDLE